MSRPVFAQVLFGRAPKLRALDSTTIDFGPSLFPGARFHRRKGAEKLHALVDLKRKF